MRPDHRAAYFADLSVEAEHPPPAAYNDVLASPAPGMARG